MTDKKAHKHKKKDNLSIQNQVGNLFSLNLFLWRHFPASSDCLLSVVSWFASSISNFSVKHRLQHLSWFVGDNLINYFLVNCGIET